MPEKKVAELEATLIWSEIWLEKYDGIIGIKDIRKLLRSIVGKPTNLKGNDMKQDIKCYVCEGIFGIEEKYRIGSYQGLRRKKHHIAKSWVKVKTVQGIVCPYCHQHLFEKILKAAG